MSRFLSTKSQVAAAVCLVQIAARHLQPEHAKLLLPKGAKPNELDQTKLTPLAAAILATLHTGSPDGLATIEALLTGGADPQVLDSRSQNILSSLSAISSNDSSGYSQADSHSSDTARKQAMPFMLDPTQYKGQNISRVQYNPMVSKIHQLLT